MSHKIGPAETIDLGAVEALLRATGLPTEGLTPFLDTLLVSRSRGEIIGCAALEVYGPAALLRSVAVHPGWQGRGLGAELVERAIWLAQSRSVRDLFLLTTTAADYFERLGFGRCFRTDAPEAVRQSVEFTTLCPESAVAMRRAIEPPERPVRARRGA
jgi:amino-acid N-acetyltransferase